MIVVIADDFTGAAEIGGIGIRYGLRVVVQTRNEELQTSADLLVVVAHTRAMSRQDAIGKIKEISSELKILEPEFIFKKIDSAMRGHILSEIKAQMEVFAVNQTLLVAGNPHLGRVISEGQYTINNVPLDKTGFANDAHFPAKSSSILEILNPEGTDRVVNLKPGQLWPDQGVIAADVTSKEDLEAWAKTPTKQPIIYAGASGFFDALLSSMDIAVAPRKAAFPFGNRIIYVEGTKFPKQIDFMQKLEEQGVYFSNMPEEIYWDRDFDRDLLDQWADDIVSAFSETNVYITMRHSGNEEDGLSERLCENLGELVWKVTARCEMDELLIEGGDTAAIVLELLKIRKLKPVHEYKTGVIRMEVIGNRNFYITTKPGSYQWPEEILVPRKVSLLR